MEVAKKGFIAEGSKAGRVSRPYTAIVTEAIRPKGLPSGRSYQRLLHFPPLDMTTFRIQAI